MRIFKTDKDVPHSSAEICLNLWYFVDDSRIVLRIAGKAYALQGSDETKLLTLHQMAGTDHLTATHAKISERFTIQSKQGELKGAALVHLFSKYTVDAYGELLDRLERDLPRCIRSVDGNYEYFTLKIPQNPLIVTTAIYEREDGELVARVASNPKIL